MKTDFERHFVKKSGTLRQLLAPPRTHSTGSRGGVCSQGYGVGERGWGKGQVAPKRSGSSGGVWELAWEPPARQKQEGIRDEPVSPCPFPAPQHEAKASKMQEKQTSPVSVRGAAKPFLSNQNVLASPILSTAMENLASSSTGSGSPSSAFCSICEKHTESGAKNKGCMESILEEYPQEGRDVQKKLKETTLLHEQQKISLRLIIADLQTKLMEVQLEIDALQDTRQKESQSQDNVKTQLQTTAQELEAANQLQEELLKSHEQVPLELCGIPMGYEDRPGEKLWECGTMTSFHIHNLSTADVLRGLDSEVSYLRGKLVLVEEELESLKKDSQAPNQPLLQQHHKREQTGTQNSAGGRQIGHLDSSTSQLRCELQGARRIYEDKVAAVKGKNESIGRISSLSVQLESTKETLHKVKEDLASKQLGLEAAERRVSDLTACVQEKERALEASREEIKELRSQLDRRLQELQHLKSEEDHLHRVQLECETLKLQVLEKERIAQIFQKQMDSMTQVVSQHSRAAGATEIEKAQLIKEINVWKVKAEEIKIAKDEKEARIHEMEARLSELELETVKLVNTCTERLHALDDMKLEKDQLLNELQVSQSELAGLAGGFEDLKRNYWDKIKEMENTASRLKMQLKSAQAELEQTRTALKTMEGSDGNAMKVAVGMQKKITAKRGQIDALWSQIKFLEEAMTNAAKEKHNLRKENNKLNQELSCIRAENTRMSGELEILKAQDKCLKEKISTLETALDKASKQFAEYQCIIQCQEQEAMRFRLQHTLDVKELQGPGYSSASASGKLRHTVPLSHLHSALLPPSLSLASCALHMPSKPHILKEEPLQDLKKVLQEPTCSGSGTVDLGQGDHNGGEKPSLATPRNAVDPSCLNTADPQSQDITLFFTSRGDSSIFSGAPCYTSFPKKASQEQRYRAKSPVHMLLTSPHNGLAAGPSTSPEHRLSTNKVGSPEAAPTAFQIASQSMKTREQTARRLQNKTESLQDLLGSSQMKKPGARFYQNYSWFI